MASWLPLNLTQTLTLTQNQAYAVPIVVDELIPEVISAEIDATGLLPFNINKILTDFQTIISNVTGSQRWASILSLGRNLSRESCQDSLLNSGVLVFVPIETEWCLELPNGEKLADLLATNRGPLGIPIPSHVQKELKKSLTEPQQGSNLPQLIDPFQINSQVQASLTSNSAERTQTQIAIESVLGRAGQKAFQEELDNLGNNLAAISRDANLALNQTATQDVMKSIAKMLARDAIINGSIRSELMQMRIDNQYTNSNLSNISKTLDQQMRTFLNNQTLNQSRLIYSSSQAYLW